MIKKVSVKVTNYDIEVIATFDFGDTVTGIKLIKDSDTFESAIIKTVEALNMVLENENSDHN